MRYEYLEPYISRDTMYLHYEKHYKGYIEKYKKLIHNTRYEKMPLHQSIQIILNNKNNNQNFIKIKQNANQIINHEFFFSGLKLDTQITSTMKTVIDYNFGTLKNFKNDLKDKVLNHFSNGWVWIVYNRFENKIYIKDTHDDESYLFSKKYHPLFVIDIWEHAYYLDNFNDRSKYFENIWNCINWNFIEQRYLFYSNK